MNNYNCKDMIQVVINSLQELDIKPTKKNLELLFAANRILEQVKTNLPEPPKEEVKEENQNGTDS